MGGKLNKTFGNHFHLELKIQRSREVFEKLVKGTVQVLEKQLAPYLIGYLSNPTPDQLAQTQSVPIDNVKAEQVVGLTDHQCRRARKTTIGFNDGN